MGIYEFKEQDAYEFARQQNIRTKVNGEQLQFEVCPYCRAKEKWKFAISLRSGAFNCLRSSCNAKGNMITLAKDFDFQLTRDFEEYYRPKKKYKTLPQPKQKIVPKTPAVKYLESRGISRAIADRYQITTQTDNEKILVFPFYDEKGQMVFVKYRKTDFDKTRDANKEWCEKACKPILFGIYQCDPTDTRLIITEGQIDSLSVAEAGFKNAVSVPTGANGFTWFPYCWDWLQKFETVVVFGDHEKGKITLLDTLSRRLPMNVLHVREEDYGDCKDANEILLKYGRKRLIKCIENAIPLPVKNTVGLAEVEDINPFDIEKLPTGFYDLDRLLYGGLPFGNLVVITGKAGLGKSTVASQIIVNAVENGKKCFAYSGELPNHLFKSWMTYQVAGQNHVYSYQTKWGDTGFNISDTNRKQIDEWYRDKIDLYDSSAITDDEQTSIVKVIEETIKRNGTEVILIHNLMTAIDLERVAGDDKYERQSKFVKKLARIAQQYNVLILLVAHMRKNNFSTNGNDEIAGSSDITNLCSVTLMYDQDTEIREDQRYLKVWKNRLFGKTKKDGWVMNYDEKSKRVFGEHDDVNREYGWCKSEDGFAALNEYQGKLPFS